MNSLSIVGRIGKVSELRSTGQGKAVLNMSVAVDNGKDSSGEKREATWFEVALWEKQAEDLAPYLVVGDRVGVTGSVILRVTEGSDGTKYSRLTIAFPRVELMGNGAKKQSSNKPAAARAPNPNYRASAARQSSRPPVEISDEDIPF